MRQHDPEPVPVFRARAAFQLRDDLSNPDCIEAFHEQAQLRYGNIW
jgi:hypothetical protein